MAKATLKQTSYSKSIINNKDHHSKINNIGYQSKLKIVNSLKTDINPLDGKTEISEKSNKSNVIEMLPFRVRFTTIGIEGASAAPIGIAIIGFNNYIL